MCQCKKAVLYMLIIYTLKYIFCSEMTPQFLTVLLESKVMASKVSVYLDILFLSLWTSTEHNQLQIMTKGILENPETFPSLTTGIFSNGQVVTWCQSKRVCFLGIKYKTLYSDPKTSCNWTSGSNWLQMIFILVFKIILIFRIILVCPIIY